MTYSLLPTISVVTPSYNQGRFLEECIRSVIEQDYPRIEYIIIDGGSTDNSLTIIQKYTSRLAYWVSEPDRGQSDAINKGWARATGDLVAWLNADDYYLPGAFQQVAKVYLENPGASFYFGNGYRVDVSGKLKEAFYPKGSLYFNREALIMGLNYIMQQATFINRRILEKVGGLNPDLHYGMDTDLWIRLSEVAPPIPVPAFLAVIREHPETKTSQGAFRRIEELRRIAEKYSGHAITPGVLSYFLDTLNRYAHEHPEIFPRHYWRAIYRFWRATNALMRMFGARPDGFPEPRILKGAEKKRRIIRFFSNKT